MAFLFFFFPLFFLLGKLEGFYFFFIFVRRNSIYADVQILMTSYVTRYRQSTFGLHHSPISTPILAQRQQDTATALLLLAIILLPTSFMDLRYRLRSFLMTSNSLRTLPTQTNAESCIHCNASRASKQIPKVCRCDHYDSPL